jgi:hypothetical protein
VADEIPFKEKIKSINFGQARHRGPKVTTDDATRRGNTTVETWDDRVGVVVRPDPVTVKLSELKKEG